jgi:N utilization substance protein A
VTTSLLYQTIDQLSKEKSIDPQIIIAAVEDAILVATRKYYKTNEELQSRFNKETGVVEVHAVKKIVAEVVDPNLEISVEDARKYDPEAALDGEVRIPKKTDVLGRIAAQTAKQVIFQKVREAERDAVYAEYSQRIGELANCTVKRLEGPDIIVDLGRTEARLPRKEQSRLESYQIGERLRGVITLVDRSARGPQVMVSRADAALVQRLFEMEVPEIYDGTVVIRTMAREAGERTKVAVYSKDPDVDCVGACVGMKGMRVQSIIRELRGEKIDIIEYDEDPVAFAANALSPAKINHVAILEAEEKHLEVIVDDAQLSAMVLRGAPVASLEGLGVKTLQKLRDHGVQTVEQLAQMTPDELTQIQGIGEKTVERIRRVVTDYFEQAEQATAKAAAPPKADTPVETKVPAAEVAQSEPPVPAEELPAEVVSAAEVAQSEPPVPAEELPAEVAPAAEVAAPGEQAEPNNETKAEQETSSPGEGGEAQ